MVILRFLAYVKSRHPDVHTVYMVGEDGLEEELGMVGLKVAKEASRPPPGMTEDEFRENSLHPEVRRFGLRWVGLGWVGLVLFLTFLRFGLAWVLSLIHI